MSAAVTQAARKAAACASRVSLYLHAASSELATDQAKREALTKAFRYWRALSRDMAALEAVAPRSAEAGYDIDAEGLEVIEAIQARGET